MEGRADIMLFFLLHFSSGKKMNLYRARSVTASGSFPKRVSTPMAAPRWASSSAPPGFCGSPRPEERRTRLVPASPPVGSPLPTDTQLRVKRSGATRACRPPRGCRPPSGQPGPLAEAPGTGVCRGLQCPSLQPGQLPAALLEDSSPGSGRAAPRSPWCPGEGTNSVRVGVAAPRLSPSDFTCALRSHNPTLPLSPESALQESPLNHGQRTSGVGLRCSAAARGDRKTLPDQTVPRDWETFGRTQRSDGSCML